MDEWGGLLTKMFCFPSVGTISWYIVPQKCSHTSIASDSAFTILYKSVTCNGCNDRGPWVTQLFQTRTTDSISVLQMGTKYFQDPLLHSGNIYIYIYNKMRKLLQLIKVCG